MSNVAAAAEDERPARVRVNAAEQAVSACSGAVLTSLFITPLDVVKVKMQHNSSIMQLPCEHAACSGTSSYSVLMRVARQGAFATFQPPRLYAAASCRMRAMYSPSAL